MDRKIFKIAVYETNDTNANEDSKDFVKHAKDIYGNLAHLLAQAMDFSFEEFREEIGGIALPCGNWTGVIGMLDRSEVDIAVVPLFVTEERSQVVDYSYPFIVSEITFMTKKPEFIPNKFGIFYVFDEPVWLAFAISMILTMLLYYVHLGGKYGCARVIFDILGTSLKQPSSIKPRSAAENLLAISWLISSTLLSMCYVSVLLSFLSFPVLRGIRTIPELAKSVDQDSYKCSALPGSNIAYLLSTSGNNFMKIIGDNIEKNPEGYIYINNFINSSENNIAFIDMRISINVFRENYFVSNDNFYLILGALAVRKNFCCKSQLEKAMRTISEAGLYQKLLEANKFVTFLPDLLIKPSEIKFPRELTAYDIGGALIILMVGYFVSFLVLLFELFLSNWY